MVRMCARSNFSYFLDNRRLSYFIKHRTIKNVKKMKLKFVGRRVQKDGKTLLILNFLLFCRNSEVPFSGTQIANQVKVDLDFKINKVKVNVGMMNIETNTDEPCLEFFIDGIAAQVKMRRWDMFVDATIKRLVLREMTQGPDGVPLELFSTPEDAHMLKVSYRQVRCSSCLHS